MRDLTPFWFRPSYQPDENLPVEFQLRPLDMALEWELQASLVGREAPTFAAAQQVFRASVLDWRGVRKADGSDLPFSPAARAEAVSATADRCWMFWCMEINGELLRRAVLSETERKNS